jgi:hypothetical protein
MAILDHLLDYKANIHNKLETSACPAEAVWEKQQQQSMILARFV